jgi:hypothetical protein
MNAVALARRNLLRQRRPRDLMGAVVALGFAAVALAGGHRAVFDGLKETTIRSVGQLQIVDKRAVSGTEEKTLEFGLRDAGRARAIVAADPFVEAVIPRIDFVGRRPTARSVPFLGVGVDPEPGARATFARELIVSAPIWPAGTRTAWCSGPGSPRRWASSRATP